MNSRHSDAWRDGYYSPLDGGNVLLWQPCTADEYKADYRAGRNQMLEELADDPE